ncbi:ABC transporter permease subunit [Paenibacillus alkaliterrae]|uniref:ABC transporter permease n=1 Tax=Paenibacillus alkaliterrae TaxID=320909 RepID=UPI001F3A5EF3|nr:ABC transporter permease subunit [Paenibacillus alkaliterrae]MCF2941078.1 ABC transporter permease subunit [Paenibacillus alkaliterrae]
MKTNTSQSAILLSKWKRIRKHYQLYLFLFPTILFFLVFHYIPMYGVTIAFKNFIASKGIIGSPWVGFDHFERFFSSYKFSIVMWNTLIINLYELLIAFPIPIILALLLNQVNNARFKKLVQTVTYAPHFISVVVIVGMLYLFLSPRNGLLNQLFAWFGGEPVFFMASAEWFKTIFVFSGVWQNAGWSMIIYLAALTAVSLDLHEAAIVDGASKFQRIWHIDLPSILPTIMILLILNIGSFMAVGFEKIYLMQNPLNIGSSEVIQTYVYQTGLLSAQYSYSAAVGLFNSVINFVLLVGFNQLAKSMKQASLW